ncbi:MAG: hypothetical protein R3F30_06160 [Planctomycetota bacterium]
MVLKLVCILAGTVIAGLGTYFGLELTGKLGLYGTTGYMTMPIWLFVTQLAVMGVLGSVLTLMFVKLLKAEAEKQHGGG